MHNVLERKPRQIPIGGSKELIDNGIQFQKRNQYAYKEQELHEDAYSLLFVLRNIHLYRGNYQ